MKTRTTLIYDLIQRFEVTDGVPRMMSQDIVIIEGGHSLMSVAQDWLKTNTTLHTNKTKHYIGYREKPLNRHYVLVLAQRGESLQVSFPHNELVVGDCKQDTLFPYASRMSITTTEKLIQLLETLFLPDERSAKGC